MASRVTREFGSSSENTHSLEIDIISTTLALVTTMLETGTKYCLRMTNAISSLIRIFPCQTWLQDADSLHTFRYIR